MLLHIKRLAAQAVGWFLVWLWPAYQLAQWASTVDFLQRLLSDEAAAFVSTWGWAVAIPLGLSILWRAESGRQKMVTTQRDFKAACALWLREGIMFRDRLSDEDEDTVLAFWRLQRRVAHAVHVALDALPEKECAAMKAAKKEAGLDYLRDHLRDEDDRKHIADLL